MAENQEVVKEELTTPQASEANTGIVAPEEVTVPAPGSKTESSLLLQSLQEEREKRRLLEEENNKLKSSFAPETSAFSDEGLMLQGKISQLESKINFLDEEKNLEKIYLKYPLLKEKASEFVEYRNAEYPKSNIESVAKLYLAENGLLENQRIGLEKSTGGSRTPTAPGMTIEDAENLRKSNYKQYKQLLMEGKLSNLK